MKHLEQLDELIARATEGEVRIGTLEFLVPTDVPGEARVDPGSTADAATITALRNLWPALRGVVGAALRGRPVETDAALLKLDRAIARELGVSDAD